MYNIFKKYRRWRLMTAILSLSLLTVMAGAAVAPALNIIQEHFHTASLGLVQMIISIPAIFIALTNLFFKRLCRRVALFQNQKHRKCLRLADRSFCFSYFILFAPFHRMRLGNTSGFCNDWFCQWSGSALYHYESNWKSRKKRCDNCHAFVVNGSLFGPVFHSHYNNCRTYSDWYPWFVLLLRGSWKQLAVFVMFQQNQTLA